MYTFVLLLLKLLLLLLPMLLLLLLLLTTTATTTTTTTTTPPPPPTRHRRRRHHQQQLRFAPCTAATRPHFKLACHREHAFALPVAVRHAEALSPGGHSSPWLFYIVGYTALCSSHRPSTPHCVRSVGRHRAVRVRLGRSRKIFPLVCSCDCVARSFVLLPAAGPLI